MPLADSVISTLSFRISLRHLRQNEGGAAGIQERRLGRYGIILTDGTVDNLPLANWEADVEATGWNEQGVGPGRGVVCDRCLGDAGGGRNADGTIRVFSPV